MFAAQISAAGTITTTAAVIRSETHPGSKLITTPSTGSSRYWLPSAVCGPSAVASTGTAISATAETPK